MAVFQKTDVKIGIVANIVTVNGVDDHLAQLVEHFVRTVDGAFVGQQRDFLVVEQHGEGLG